VEIEVKMTDVEARMTDVEASGDLRRKTDLEAKDKTSLLAARQSTQNFTGARGEAMLAV